MSEPTKPEQREIKPCPVCHAKPYVDDHLDFAHVRCRSCDADINIEGRNVTEAIIKWNSFWCWEKMDEIRRTAVREDEAVKGLVEAIPELLDYADPHREHESDQVIGFPHPETCLTCSTDDDEVDYYRNRHLKIYEALSRFEEKHGELERLK